MSETGPDFQFEATLWAAGHLHVAGVDEAGAGPLAGPVYAAAVILRRHDAPPGINDSKTLTEAERDALAPVIKARAIAWSVASCTPSEIDTYNIRRACLIAMRRAIDALEPAAHAVVIDYHSLSDLRIPQLSITKGDTLSLSIGAASILAKTTRDALMVEHDARYPGYGFARHKGYGTPEHLAALKRLGPCPLHRSSYAPVREAMGLLPAQPSLDLAE